MHFQQRAHRQRDGVWRGVPICRFHKARAGSRSRRETRSRTRSTIERRDPSRPTASPSADPLPSGALVRRLARLAWTSCTEALGTVLVCPRVRSPRGREPPRSDLRVVADEVLGDVPVVVSNTASVGVGPPGSAIRRTTCRTSCGDHRDSPTGGTWGGGRPGAHFGAQRTEPGDRRVRPRIHGDGNQRGSRRRDRRHPDRHARSRRVVRGGRVRPVLHDEGRRGDVRARAAWPAARSPRC